MNPNKPSIAIVSTINGINPPKTVLMRISHTKALELQRRR